ncbi:MAG: penicillin-binding transpeptidase domain-containing protein [Oscillospiraceae bacterium]
MDAKQFSRRLAVIVGFFAACLFCFFIALFDAQVTHGAENLERSVSTITRQETVPASRGVITDRNGKVMVSNRLVYTLTFRSTGFASDEEENLAILRLLELLEKYEVEWTDTLPIDRTSPRYTSDAVSPTYLSRFSDYLLDRKFQETELTEENPIPSLSASALVEKMRKDFGVPEEMSYADARKVLGVRYELAVRKLVNTNAYVLAEDLSVELISEINDGSYLGATVGTGSVRQYATESAAHVLGYVGAIDRDEYAVLKEQGYAMDAIVGKVGAEKAFENYLRGLSGKRVVTTNDEGRITSEVYTVEPQPGHTVALTLDLDFQTQVEEILASATEAMTAEDGIARGAAAVAMGVGNGEVLALASYPTYSLATFNEDYNVLSQMEVSPYYNRATSGTYAPGSTFKMVTAVAALETGVITPSTTIRDEGVYKYYAPSYQPRCWIYSATGGTHGRVNVTDAIRESCNYFFYEVGRLTGISVIDDYAQQFGLGSSTGIEIGDRAGTLASPETAEKLGQVWYDGQTLAAAIGQSYNEFTPLQLANYIATLVGGGEHYAPHLLKSVKTYDGSAVVEVYDEGPLNTVRMSDATREAVLEGMHELVQSGSVAYSFSRCVVDAGAKTGTAQTGQSTNNGVFVCFAPYDDPQIVLALVIEKGGSGSALASAAVDMLNAYFSETVPDNAVTGENTLLP